MNDDPKAPMLEQAIWSNWHGAGNLRSKQLQQQIGGTSKKPPLSRIKQECRKIACHYL